MRTPERKECKMAMLDPSQFIKPGRYARYLRKSRADIKLEKESGCDTLTKHRQDTDQFCSEQGYLIDADHCEVVSGESIAERIEFQRLMADVQKGLYAGVIVHAVDRLGRGDIAEYGWVLSTFQMTGTLIITPQRTYDPRDFGDFLALTLLMLISSAELENTKRRYKQGRERNVKNGQYIASHAPYGYVKANDEQERHTLVASEHAPRVMYIFNSVASGKGTPTSLAHEFNASGVPTPKDCGAWHPRTIKNIIRNKAYMGVIEWGRRPIETTVDEKGYRRKRRSGLKAAAATGKGLHVPLVSEDVWKAANANVTASEKVRTSDKLQNPLAGVLVCAKCGKRVRSLYSPHTKCRRYYHEGFTTCPGWKGCNMGDVIDVLIATLNAMVGDVEVRLGNGETDLMLHDAKLEGLRADLAAVERKYKRLLELYLEDSSSMSIKTLRERQEELEKSKESLVLSINELEAKKPPKLEDVKVKLKEVIETLDDPDIEAEIKNTMLKQAFKKIEMENLSTTPGVNDIRLNIEPRDE